MNGGVALLVRQEKKITEVGSFLSVFFFSFSLVLERIL